MMGNSDILHPSKPKGARIQAEHANSNPSRSCKEGGLQGMSSELNLCHTQNQVVIDLFKHTSDMKVDILIDAYDN